MWQSNFGQTAVIDLHVVLSFSVDGDAEARGTVHVRDGTSNTFLIGEAPPRATCADADGDGTAGITSLQLVGRNPQSGEEVLVVLVPGDNDLDARGEYEVGVRMGDVSSEITLTFLPLPAGPPEAIASDQPASG